jgi:hypothetical protein
MKYGILILTVLILFALACEKRVPEKPDLSFTVVNETIYNRQNYNSTDINVSLSGTEDMIANKRIDIVYDHDIATLIGGATNYYLITDENGEANGTIYAQNDYIGDLAVKATYDSQKLDRNIVVYDMPEFQYFTSDVDRLPADGESQAHLRLKLDSSSDILENQIVYITTTVGTLSADSLFCDNKGVATAVFTAPGISDLARVRASLKICPSEVILLNLPCD